MSGSVDRGAMVQDQQSGPNRLVGKSQSSQTPPSASIALVSCMPSPFSSGLCNGFARPATSYRRVRRGDAAQYRLDLSGRGRNFLIARADCG
ncbi:MAG: hypothetical protein IPN48_16325 [Sphingomonadales bacterium]|nr:hypothetical protein [Sphingomonadales bacterium]